MPRRAKDRKGIWRSTTLLYGYVLDRNGVATLCYRKHMRSTGLPFHDDHKAECLQRLIEWVSAIDSGMPSVASPVQVPRTIFAFYEREWKPHLKATASTATRRHFWDAIQTFFPEDCPLNTDRLAAVIRRRDAELRKELSNTTRVKRLRYIRRTFDEAVRRRLLDRNPFDFLDQPRAPKSSAIKVFSAADVAELMRWFAERERQHRLAPIKGVRKGYDYRRFNELWRLLLFTGMRISEALALKWSDVAEDYTLTIHGKREREDIPKDRGFPAGSFPELVRLLKRLRARRPEGCDYVIPWWRSGQPVGDMLRVAMKEIAARKSRPRRIVGTVHTWRATAGQRLLDMGFPDDLIADLLGHTLTVRRLHYRPLQQSRNLAARIDKVRGE